MSCKLESTLRGIGSGPPAPARAWFGTAVDAGADPADLRAEIATILWPWARRFAERSVRRLPRHCDAAEVHSRVNIALWQCCTRFDWDSSPAWSAWLSIRLRGAVIDAARASDRLSRRDRRRLSDGTADEQVVAGANAVPIDEATELAADVPDPSRSVVDREVVRAVHAWILEDLPVDLAGRLQDWLLRTDATTSLTSELAMEIEPYVFRLVPAAALID